MKRFSIAILAGALVIGVVLLAILLFFFVSKREPPSQQPSQNASPLLNPIHIAIRNPAEGGVFPLNGSVPVQVELSSQEPLQGIQFWLDGVEIGSVVPDMMANSAWFTFPSTQLEGENWHSLYAEARDQSGRATLSNVIHIKSSPPVGMETFYAVKEGDTLNSIATEKQADSIKIQARNPGWTGGADDVLPAGAMLIIPFDAPAQAETGPSLQGESIQFNSSLPKPPSISAQVDQCNVSITLQDIPEGANGFTLYRLNPGSDSFTPISSYKGSQKSPLVYLDKNAAGGVQYIASAYTDQGETFGDPVAITLTAPGCSSSSSLPISGNILTLPLASSATYFYTSFDGNGYQRYPATDGEFLNLKKGSFDLTNLSAAKGVQPGESVALEAWGWDSGQLSQLGTAFARIDAAPGLSVCPDGINCGGTGEFTTHYSTSAVVGSDQEEQARRFKWEIDSPSAKAYDSVLFQLSVQPIAAESQENPPGLAYSKILSATETSGNTIGGTFDLDFKHLGEEYSLAGKENVNFAGFLVTPDEALSPQDPWLSKQYEKYNPGNVGGVFLQIPEANLNHDFWSIPRTYYARIIPLSGGKLTQTPSNMVTIDYKPTGEGNITVEPERPSIYDIEIVSSAAPIPPYSHWGCVDILAINPNSWVWTTEGMWNLFYGRLENFQGLLQNHQPYCPSPYKPDEKAWYEDLWDWVNDGLDFINDAYQAAKKLSVDSMLVQFDLIGAWELCPLPDCRDTVFAGLMKGQELVLQETYGLPAEIPNLNQLTDDGIDALAEQALKYAGLDGDACPKEVLDCKKFLTDGMHKLKEEFMNQTMASYQDDAIAHSQGYYGLLLPIDPTALTVQPAKSQNWQMAETVIRVTRKPDATNLTEEQLAKLHFTLYAEVSAVNETCRNRKYSYCTNINTVNGGPGVCAEQFAVLPDAPCEGILFSGTKDIPLLAPGESREFTIELLPQTYWSPEMPEEYKPYNPENDFDLLYYGANAVLIVRLLSNTYMNETSAGPDPFTLTDLNTSALLGSH